MLIKNLFIILTILLIYSCEENNKSGETAFENIFIFKKEIFIPDSLGVKEYFLSIKYLSDSTVYFTELFSKKLFQVNMNSERIRPLGNIGMGPKEYSGGVNDFFLENDTLYTKPRSGLLIKRTSPDFLNHYSSIKSKILVKKMSKIGDEIYILNRDNSQYRIHSVDGKGFDENQYVFNMNKKTLQPINMVSHKSYLYYLNGYENILHAFNAMTKEVTLIPFGKELNYYNWKSDYKTKKLPEFFEKNEKEFDYNSELSKMIVNNVLYFIISTSPNKNKNSKIIIFDINGNTIEHTVSNNLYFVSAFGKKALFLRFDDMGDIFFREYEINETIFN